MSKTTTPQQYEELSNLMATKTDIASGYHKRSKEEVQAFWDEVTSTLNAVGPPTKTATAWKKVWIDWKSYIKRKLSANKKEMVSTGGGHCRLQRISPLEEKIIQLTGLVTNTSGVTSAEDYGVASALAEDARGCAMDISINSEASADVASGSQRRQQQGAKETTFSLLKRLCTKQEEFNGTSKNYQESVVTYMRRLNRNVERLADTAEKQHAEQQRHNILKEELLQQKVRIKLEMLRLQHPNHNLD